MKNKFLNAVLFGLLVLVAPGCGAFFVPVVVSGAGGGVAYTVTNVAYKTFNRSVKDVERAVKSALKKMEIKEGEREEAEDGVRLVARTEKLRIYIDLEEITPKTTRMRVDAKKSRLLKDKATATEIIVLTEKILEG